MALQEKAKVAAEIPGEEMAIWLAVFVVQKNILQPDVRHEKGLAKVLQVGLVRAVRHHRWARIKKVVPHIGSPLRRKDQATWL